MKAIKGGTPCVHAHTHTHTSVDHLAEVYLQVYQKHLPHTLGGKIRTVKCDYDELSPSYSGSIHIHSLAHRVLIRRSTACKIENMLSNEH